MRPKKVLNLIKISSLVNVPSFIHLGEEYFGEAFVNYDQVNEAIENILLQVSSTYGSSIGKDVDRIIAEANNLIWRSDVAEHLHLYFSGAASEILNDKMAVRSAADDEDLDDRSFAGLYTSVLNVEGETALREAILKVWKSYWSRAAVMQRLQSGTLNTGKRMNIMIQKMVDPLFAGVAFSMDPVIHAKDVVIEFLDGCGEALVSGMRKGKTVRESEYSCNSYPYFLKEVFEAVHMLKVFFNKELDIEWAWTASNKLYILQVRDITNVNHPATTDSIKPVFNWMDLYLSGDADFSKMGTMPDFAYYFRNKRRALQVFAKEMGLNASAAIVLKFNRWGMQQQTEVETFVSGFESPTVVIDAGKNIRQLIVKTEELPNELTHLANLQGDEIKTIVVRDYITGDFGFISRMDSGKVFCEGSSKGLLVLNRGTSDSRVFYCEDITAVREAGFSAQQRDQIIECTRMSQEKFGSIQLEWVRDGSRLHLIDYSKIQLNDSCFSLGNAGGMIVSKGYGSGHLLKITDSMVLKNYSEAAAISLNDIPDYDDLNYELKDMIDRARLFKMPPLVLASRPYAALAALVPYVSGFVFKNSSLLCHLAIIIRENKLPALASEEVYNNLLQQETYELDLY